MAFLAWVTQEVMSLTTKGNVEEKSDLGGKVSSDNLLTAGHQ